MLGLTWDRVDFDDSRIHFANMKGHKDRFVPVNDDVIRVLRKWQAQTLQDGAPFVGMDKPMQRRSDSILAAAEVSHVTPQNLRRTYVTLLVRAGVPLPTVQKLAGHRSISTTVEYYNWVNDDDLREGVAKLAATAG
ncbi:MAG: site-specific integrase [Planctomycetes bacterium]|nr:site-specific integrase [Planctomycetota bacterium]